MLNFFRRLIQSRHSGEVDLRIREITERSVVKVKQRLVADISRMSVAELHGYIRARAIRVVRQQAQPAALCEGCLPMPTEDLVVRSLDRIAHLLTRQLMSQPAVALLSSPVPLRKAG